MTTDMEQIKERIKKLLNLAADDAAADGEIANAIKFARRLMQKHQIDEAELNASRDVHETAADTEYGTSDAASMGSNLAQWECSLAHLVCRLVGTTQRFLTREKQTNRDSRGIVVLNPHSGEAATVRVVKFYGPAQDAADAAGMWRSWLETIVAMARLRFGGALRGSGRSYCEGFVAALNEKIREELGDEQRKLAEDSADKGWALAVRNANELTLAKRERGSAWLKQTMGFTLTNGSRNGSSRSHDGAAYGAGKSDGSRAAFGRTQSRTRRIGSGS